MVSLHAQRSCTLKGVRGAGSHAKGKSKIKLFIRKAFIPSEGSLGLRRTVRELPEWIRQDASGSEKTAKMNQRRTRHVSLQKEPRVPEIQGAEHPLLSALPPGGQSLECTVLPTPHSGWLGLGGAVLPGGLSCSNLGGKLSLANPENGPHDS